MLAGKVGLKLFDLFPDFLFALTGGKEDVVGVSALLSNSLRRPDQ